MDYLREVDVDILSRQTCEDWFHEANHAMSINSDQICAGYKYGKKDACKVRKIQEVEETAKLM